MNVNKIVPFTSEDIDIEKAQIKFLADKGNLQEAKSEFNSLLSKIKEQNISKPILGGLIIWFAGVFMTAKTKIDTQRLNDLKKLLILIFFLFITSCNKITVIESFPLNMNPPSKGYRFDIDKQQYLAPNVFIQPYQHLLVNCSDQPCIASLGETLRYSKYDGKNFLIDITTSEIYNENTAKVGDHQYIEVKLANDAYKENVSVTLVLSNKRYCSNDLFFVTLSNAKKTTNHSIIENRQKFFDTDSN